VDEFEQRTEVVSAHLRIAVRRDGHGVVDQCWAGLSADLI